MQLVLSSNNHVTAKPDSAEHHLYRVLSAIRNANSPQDRADAFQLAGVLNGAVRALAEKHHNVLLCFAQLYSCTGFRTNPISPQRLIETTKVVWGVSVWCHFLVHASTDISLRLWRRF